MTSGVRSIMKGVVSRTLPQATTDQDDQPVRLGRYQEIEVIEALRTKHPLADEGTYFVYTNPTLGTGVAYAIQASFSATAAAFVIQNTSDPANGFAKEVHVDYVKIAVTVVPATASGWRWGAVIDTGSRIPSAGNSLLTAAQPGPVIGASIAKVWGFNAAAITVPAAVNARTIGTGGGGGLPVVGTELMIRFGDVGASTGGPNNSTSHAAPMIVPPGSFGIIYLWFPGNATTALSGEWDVGSWER